MQFMKIGGLLMWFIFALGVLGLYAILERTVYFMIREKNSIANLNKKLKDMLEKNKIKEAIVHLNSNKSSSARVLQAILIYGYKENKKSLEALEEKGKEVAIQQLRHLERNMWLISVAAHGCTVWNRRSCRIGERNFRSFVYDSRRTFCSNSGNDPL